MHRLQADHLVSLVTELFITAGAQADDAHCVADHLVVSSMMGIHSHGLMRVPPYIEQLRDGTIRSGAPREVLQDNGSCLLMRYGWTFGQVAACDLIERGLKKAAEFGTACVVGRECAHAGRLGAFTEQAARQGMIALGFCNSGPHGHFVAPWGGREGRLATNPLAFAIPQGESGIIASDFSTASMPEGKIRIQLMKGEELPEGCIVDAGGHQSTDPADFYGPPRGAILPFGGETGYRGYALGILVEVLGGLLGGQSMREPSPGNGLGFVLIDPARFLSGNLFNRLSSELRDYMKHTPTAEGFDEILLPGECEARAAEEARRDGLLLSDELWNPIAEWADKLHVELPVVPQR